MLVLVALSSTASAVCVSVEEFNTYMESHDPSDTVTLRFDATGVNPNDWFGTKGALADLTDDTCSAGGSLALKVYGPDDPPNTSHPTGTLKQEYGYNCGPMPYTETWADPNASEVIFTDGTERCDVTIWIDPSTFGYRLECDHGTWEGLGDNDPAMPVNYISVFSLVDGSTWRMPNASSTWNEVCFEPTEGEDTTVEEPSPSELQSAVQDVTVATDFPSSVYSDTDDLCVEAGYSEVYLQFDLSAIPGTITSATLELTAASDSSANGSGTEVYAVGSTAWTENDLTWNARPGGAGAALDRVAPIEAGAAYTMDVSAAVSAPGVYAFGLIPASADTNGAHFVSTEASDTDGPRLRLTYVADDGGGEDTEDTEDTEVEDTDGAEDTDVANDTDVTTGEDTATGAAPTHDPKMGLGCACDTGASPGWLAALLGLMAVRRRR